MKKTQRSINIFSVSTLDLFASAMGAFVLLTLVLFPYYRRHKHGDELRVQAEARARVLADENAALRERAAAAEQSITQAQAQAEAAQRDADQARTAEQEARRAARDSHAQAQSAADAQRAAEAEAAAARDRERSASDEAARLRRTLTTPFFASIVTWKTTDDIDLHVIDAQGRHYFWDKRSFPDAPAANFEEDTLRGPGNEVWIHRKAPPGRYRLEVAVYKKNDPATAVISGYVVHPEGRFELPETRLGREKERRTLGTVIVQEDGSVTFEPAS